MWKRLRAPIRGRYLLLVVLVAVATPRAAETPADEGRRKMLDEILDMDVRDGFVYYRALRADRAKLERYVTALSEADPMTMSKEEQLAFWLNAYDALVLETVVDHYPIQGRGRGYPAKSIRQVPGAFEKLMHRVAGRSLTLDDIEQKILPDFHDPRVYFAIGRGSVGGGRLRSEAYNAAALPTQLGEVAAECTNRVQCVNIDRDANKVIASPIFSWHEQEFVAAYADKAPPFFASRSPIERAILAYVMPRLLTTEKDFLEKNTFQLAYGTYDWTLNDLTGRGGR